MKPINHRLCLWAISVALAASSMVLQCGIFEEFPPFPYFDEVYTVPASRAVVEDPSAIGPEHPPLVPYLMSISQRFLGETPSGWRFISRLCGSLSLSAVFLIGVSLTGSLLGPLLGALMLLVDGLSLTLSRTGTWDAPYVCFGLYAVLIALYASRRVKPTTPYALYIVAGVTLGLSLASKWSGIFFLGPIGVVALMERSPRRWYGRIVVISLMSLVSIIVYVGVTCSLRNLSLPEFYEHTKNALAFHISLAQPHRYVSPPWSWPLLIRPIWFGYKELPYLAIDGSPAARGMVCLGNPIVFLVTGVSSLAIFAAAVWQVMRKRLSPALCVPLVGYLSCWLPWMMLSQRTGFLYYFYPSIAFACVGYGVVTSYILARGRWLGGASCLLMVLAIASGVVYLPVYFSIPTSRAWMDKILFASTWW